MPSATIDVRPPAISRHPSLITGLLLIFGFAPLLCLFFENLWSRPHYQFFPLAIIGAGFLAWVRFKEIERPLRPGGRGMSAIFFGSAFLLLILAAALWSPWLGMLSALIAIIGAIWNAGGGSLLLAMTPALVLIVAIIPPPLALDTRFAEVLRVIAVGSSSRLLDLLGVIHSRSGNVIELPGQKLLVEEACSGINSVLVVMAGTLFYMLWRRRSPLRITLALMAVVSFVLLGNLARITAGAWLKSRYGIEILSGWRHEAAGILLFIGYILLIFSLDNWLKFLFSPLPKRKPIFPGSGAQPVQQVSAASEPTQSHGTAVSPGVARFAALGFASVGLLSLGLGWKHYQTDKAQAAIPKSALIKGATFTLPDHIGQWTRLNSDSPLIQKVETLGVFSQVWHYQKGDALVSVALDYPFSGYHDVTLCYTLRGWRLLQRQSSTESDFSYAQAQMQNELGAYGDLWFSTVDERGHWIDKPAMQLTLVEKFKLPGEIEPTTYRIQALTTAYTPSSAAEQQQIKELFEQARKLLWSQLSVQMRAQ